MGQLSRNPGPLTTRTPQGHIGLFRSYFTFTSVYMQWNFNFTSSECMFSLNLRYKFIVLLKGHKIGVKNSLNLRVLTFAIVHLSFDVLPVETPSILHAFHSWSFQITSVVNGPSKLTNKTCAASSVRMNSVNKTSGNKQAKPYHFCLNCFRESRCRIV
jgi:hypothetical protein